MKSNMFAKLHSGGRALLVFVATALLAVPVIRAAAAESDGASSNWPSYFGNDRAWSYSKLQKINRGNVARLVPAWVFSTGGGKDGLSSTPLVIDGILYLPTSQNSVIALEAATGRIVWTFTDKPAEGRSGPRKPLGLATGFGMIFLAAADHHLIALDQKTGREKWNVEISDPRQCGCGPGVAPLLVKDKVVLGVSSTDTGHRGYIDAFDAMTGRLAWRFWAIPGPGEPGHDTWPEDLWRLGTSSTWLVGSYDPDLNLIYWGIGNPGPMIGGNYPGNKLYSDSIVALDADTGKLKWHFQHIPNDKLDYDSTLEAVLVDADVQGTPRKLLVQPTKGGFAYVLDRTTGAFIHGYPFAEVINWTKGLDQNGMPLEPRLTLVQDVETHVCPGMFGARGAGHSTYSPKTRLWYNTSYETCTEQTALAPKAPQEGLAFLGSSFRNTLVPADAHPFIAAFDPITGQRRWTSFTNSVNASSLLSTAGNLIFGGDLFGNVWALDATNGKKLWSFNVGTGISSMPISFAVNGRQFIAVTAGLSWVASGLANEVLTAAQKAMLPPVGSQLFAFALPESAPAVARSP
jgi:alcohol dehydrogenase (cytochrome c)